MIISISFEYDTLCGRTVALCIVPRGTENRRVCVGYGWDALATGCGGCWDCGMEQYIYEKNCDHISWFSVGANETCKREVIIQKAI